LTELHLNQTGLLDIGLTVLASSPHSLKFNEFGLSNDGITHAGLRSLVRRAGWAGPVKLNLTNNNLGDDGVSELHGSSWDRLTHLDLIGNGISPVGVRSLVSWRGIRRLRYLGLGGNPLGPEGVRTLASTSDLPALRDLDLTNVHAGDAGAVTLAECAALGELRGLRLGQNSITDAGARALANSPYLANLRFLGLWGNNIGRRTKVALKERFGSRVQC
jgi:hypothetical protein